MPFEERMHVAHTMTQYIKLNCCCAYKNIKGLYSVIYLLYTCNLLFYLKGGIMILLTFWICLVDVACMYYSHNNNSLFLWVTTINICCLRVSKVLTTYRSFLLTCPSFLLLCLQFLLYLSIEYVYYVIHYSAWSVLLFGNSH